MTVRILEGLMPFRLKVWYFILHLRLHYQLFILSGGYLLGGLLVADPDWIQYQYQFLNVHILLFGGATVFNSYWDEDKGPIGGLRNPPAMERWMRDASVIMQFAGFLWACSVSLMYGMIYATSSVLFWLYSTPLARWKGRPVLSMVAIGISTGTNSLFLGVFAAGGSWSGQILTAGLGTALIILSLYPVSQIFQLNEDSQRNDRTFALHFGMRGVRRFFSASFIGGVFLISISLQAADIITSLLFAFAGTIIWLCLSVWIYQLKGHEHEYNMVMKIKFLASFSFVTFITVTMIVKHLIFGGV